MSVSMNIKEMVSRNKSILQSPTKGVLENYEQSGIKELQMKRNNLLARNFKDEPLSHYMKID